jgi:holo-[acyl-carrier protein] synthase
MGVLTTGVDIIEIDRVRRALERHGGRFLERVYTVPEVAFCRGRIPELAARFAAKEAVMKALGTGARGVAWREIEVLPNRRGKPLVFLHDRAERRSQSIGLGPLEISLTHSQEFAIAVVVGERHFADDGRDSERLTYEEALNNLIRWGVL